DGGGTSVGTQRISATSTILARLMRSRRGDSLRHETNNRRVCDNDDVGVRRSGVGRFGAGVGYRPSRARLWPGTAVPLVPRGILAPGMGLQLRLEYLPRRSPPRWRRRQPQQRFSVGLRRRSAPVGGEPVGPARVWCSITAPNAAVGPPPVG